MKSSLGTYNTLPEGSYATMPKASLLFKHDKQLFLRYTSILGVDEAGRGALAGPVVAAGVWASGAFFHSSTHRDLTVGINDSKLLNEEKREAYFKQIKALVKKDILAFTQAQEDVDSIETYNILGATKRAMATCITTLKEQVPARFFFTQNEPCDVFHFDEAKETSKTLIIIDGKPLKFFPYKHQAIVQGDGKSLLIAMASIIAKVARDQWMRTVHKQYPCYGFDRHKGYGTLEHLRAIDQYGPCPIHRPSFLKKRLNPSNNTDQIELIFNN